MEQITKFLGAKPMNIVVPALLFIMLSPRYLFAINDGFQPMFMPMTGAPLSSIAVHALLFAVIYGLLRMNFPEFY
jgi:hypothetical protein